MKRTRLVAAAMALMATGMLGACTSQPSAKAVAKDMVQSITVPGGAHLPQVQQDCMLAIIDNMSSAEIDQLGAENLNATFTSSGGGNPAMQHFIDQLQACPTTGTTPTTAAG